MSTQTELLSHLLDRVRREMYGHIPDKWFAQQAMVKKALTYPAHWLRERHIPFTAQRYREILDLIITTMVQKGNLTRIEYMSRYILHCVQEHMRHHDDLYYLEGKGVRSHLEVAMRQLERTAKPADPTISILAEVHASIQIGKRKPKKAASSVREPDLFAAAKPVKRA